MESKNKRPSYKDLAEACKQIKKVRGVYSAKVVDQNDRLDLVTRRGSKKLAGDLYEEHGETQLFEKNGDRVKKRLKRLGIDLNGMMLAEILMYGKHYGVMVLAVGKEKYFWRQRSTCGQF